MKPPFKIGILASGSGSNAEQIITFLKPFEQIQIAFIASNRSKAKVLERAENHGIPHFHFSTKNLAEENILDRFEPYQADAVILAGFLAKIPAHLIQKFDNKIVNIHPALLPKFGGKGMYGHHVHEAVFNAKETTSGMTIHLVNEEYDKGAILFQAKTNIEPKDNPTSIASKVLALEHFHYPRVIKTWIDKLREP